jgi:hypothetical protein
VFRIDCHFLFVFSVGDTVWDNEGVVLRGIAEFYTMTAELKNEAIGTFVAEIEEGVEIGILVFHFM